MSDDFNFLKTKGDKWINNHEINSSSSGYLNNSLFNYLPLKRSIFEKIENNTNKDTFRYLNAIRIYSYSIYENLWFGNVIAKSNFNSVNFNLSGYNFTLAPDNLFKSHLPSFSSAIMNFGTCRDFYFVLLRMVTNPDFAKNPNNIKKTITINYKSNSSGFNQDLKNLTTDVKYHKEAAQYLYNNEFRNFYAHRLRLIWAKNIKTSEYCFKKELVDAIDLNDIRIWTNHLFDIFSDTIKYENDIRDSDLMDVISSNTILNEYHDKFAEFINNTYGLIKIKIDKEI